MNQQEIYLELIMDSMRRIDVVTENPYIKQQLDFILECVINWAVLDGDNNGIYDWHV